MIFFVSRGPEQKTGRTYQKERGERSFRSSGGVWCCVGSFRLFRCVRWARMKRFGFGVITWCGYKRGRCLPVPLFISRIFHRHKSRDRRQASGEHSVAMVPRHPDSSGTLSERSAASKSIIPTSRRESNGSRRRGFCVRRALFVAERARRRRRRKRNTARRRRATYVRYDGSESRPGGFNPVSPPAR